jgi:hypothetical protein
MGHERVLAFMQSTLQQNGEGATHGRVRLFVLSALTRAPGGLTRRRQGNHHRRDGSPAHPPSVSEPAGRRDEQNRRDPRQVPASFAAPLLGHRHTWASISARSWARSIIAAPGPRRRARLPRARPRQQPPSPGVRPGARGERYGRGGRASVPSIAGPAPAAGQHEEQDQDQEDCHRATVARMPGGFNDGRLR